MNKEIKEILDDLDYCKNRQRGTITLTHNECDLLLDCIFDLEEKIQKREEYIKYLKDKGTIIKGKVYYGDNIPYKKGKKERV